MKKKKIISRTFVVALVLLLLVGIRADGQTTGPDVVDDVALVQHLDQQIPLDLTFRDEAGRTVKLGDYFGEKPLLLVLAYYRCPSLCGEVLNGVVRALRPSKYRIGKEFNVLTVSINPFETSELAREKKESYIKNYNHPEAADGWHFLTGDEPQIKALAKAVGFKYVYDEKSGQYAHPGGIMIATPKGKLSRYYYGVEYSTRDIEYGLLESADERIGTLADEITVLCFQYDPMTGKYGFAIMRAVQIGGVATLLGLGWFIYRSLRKERKKNVGLPLIS